MEILSNFFLSFMIITSLFVKIINQDQTTTAYIRIKNDKTWSIDDTKSEEYIYVAEAIYGKGIEGTGWDTLAIKTNNFYGDEIQSEAAGRLEGYLTKERIYSHFLNCKTLMTLNENITNFLSKQEQYVTESHKENPKDAIMYNAYLLNLQLKGLRDSYNENVDDTKKISINDFYLISAHADLFDLFDKYHKIDFNKMSVDELLTFIRDRSHCSALFTTTYDLKDIFLGHNSWYRYTFSTRIIKEYNFNFNDPSIKAKNLMMSSYPGILNSLDDFYVTSQNLAIIETTEIYFNKDLYEFIIPESLLCWQRAMIANRMADNSKDWASIFSEYNSGTYNNQYMILDMKKYDYEIGKIDNEAFYVVDQIPGYIGINDATDQLKFGYWPSYNSPFDKKVIELGKIEEFIEKDEKLINSTDYNRCARAKIMRRDHDKITSIDDFKEFLRYNDYLNDEFSNNNPELTISSRRDLADSYCGGAYDAKAISVKDFMKNSKKTINLIYGPTTSHNLPQFDWTTSHACENSSHIGLPNQPNFQWITYTNKYDW